MATWISHMMIVDNLLNRGIELPKKHICFVGMCKSYVSG